MTKNVIVVGAGGYIGLEVVSEFVRQGWRTTGVIRKPEKKQSVLRTGAFVKVGDIYANPDEFSKEIKDADVVFDAAGPMGIDFEPLTKAIEDAARASGRTKKLIYTSGVLVYGDSQDIKGDDCEKYVFREKEERFFLKKRNNVVTSILRAVFVYGGTFGNFGAHWFTKGDENGKLPVDGNGERRIQWVHVNDVARLAVIMANAQNESIWAKAVNCGDVAQCYKWKDIRMAMGRAAGWKVIGSDSDIVKIDPFFPPIDVTVIVTADRAASLGWKPQQLPLLEYSEHYCEVWKAISES